MLLLVILCHVGGAHAADVDVAIVFAIDTSASVDPVTAKLQREGHATALSEPEVIAAISSGLNRCVAVAYLEWAGPGQTKIILPWTRICDLAGGLVVAKAIRSHGSDGDHCPGYCSTSISLALEASGALLDAFAGSTTRRVIDISSNGKNNDGPPLEESRARALAGGSTTINAIIIPQLRKGVAYHLVDYFSTNVIGGPGAFVVEPSVPEDYSSAIQRKLVREISQAGELPPADGNVPRMP